MPMPESVRAIDVPKPVRELVLGYLNTCQVMNKLWFWAMGILALALPLGFYGAGNTQVEALINGGGFWLITGILSRLAVFEFRQLRAGWVARKIGRRIRAGTPEWESLVLWIADNNDGNYLNTVLKKLGVSPRSTGIFATPLKESLAGTAPQVAEMAGEFFQKLVPSVDSDSTQTCVYTTTKTQMLNDDGEWVTVDSETTSHGDVPVDEAMRRAMAMLEEAGAELPAGMAAADAAARPASIPLSSAGGERPRPVRVEARERRRHPDYLPLELDEFDPDDDEETEEASVGVSKSGGKD
jgi:hypothetical protein